MLKVLIRKQITEIFRSYFYDAKKGKARSKKSTILYMLLFAFLMIIVIGGMFYILSLNLCEPIVSLNADWLYFDIMSLMAIALGTFGSVFSTYSSLYLAKDNDLLLSLPIKVEKIIISRLLTVYVMGLMYSVVVIIPAVIVYWLNVKKITLAIIVGNILTVVIISLIVLLLSCLLGYVVAKLSLKLRNKGIATALASLAFLGLYYYFYFRAGEMISYFLQNILYIGDKIKSSAYPLYLFGLAAIGDWKALLIVIAIISILCYLMWKVLSKEFILIATSSASEKKRKFKGISEKKKSIFATLLSKEFMIFTGSANYMLNCGLSTLFIPIAAVGLLIKKNDLLAMINFIFDGDSTLAIVIACGITILLISMNDMAVCSTSLEGKSFWLTRSLPVRTIDILKAKLAIQLILTLPVIWLFTACVLIVIPHEFIFGLLVIIFNTFITVLYALFCLFLGIKMANLHWTSEIVVIKQSWSVMIAIFSCWISALIYIITCLNINALSMSTYLIVWILLAIICCIALYIWIKKKGVNTFEEL